VTKRGPHGPSSCLRRSALSATRALRLRRLSARAVVVAGWQHVGAVGITHERASVRRGRSGTRFVAVRCRVPARGVPRSRLCGRAAAAGAQARRCCPQARDLAVAVGGGCDASASRQTRSRIGG
jgi:hypothetical protein